MKRKLTEEEINKHSVRAHLQEELKDPNFAKEFEQSVRALQLGYQIAMARERLGITQAELARKIGTRQSNISRLEQGNYNFTVEMLYKIARALDTGLKIELTSGDIKKAA